MINFKETLKEECKKINLELDEQALNRFEIYKDLLIQWNEKINLTAITEEYEVIMKHFIDCLEIVKYINEKESVIDVGTGAGFPGIVIAIYFNSNIRITLVDALEKRVKFLQEVISKLELKNVEIIHSRAEELSRNENYREKFDVVTSRAVSALNVLLEFNIPLLKKDGRALLLKGSNLQSELDTSKKALQVLKCKITNTYEYNYKINEEIYNRYILEVLKEDKTSDKYPRNYGKIKKNPL